MTVDGRVVAILALQTSTLFKLSNSEACKRKWILRKDGRIKAAEREQE